MKKLKDLHWGRIVACLLTLVSFLMLTFGTLVTSRTTIHEEGNIKVISEIHFKGIGFIFGHEPANVLDSKVTFNTGLFVVWLLLLIAIVFLLVSGVILPLLKKGEKIGKFTACASGLLLLVAGIMSFFTVKFVDSATEFPFDESYHLGTPALWAGIIAIVVAVLLIAPVCLGLLSNKKAKRK